MALPLEEPVPEKSAGVCGGGGGVGESTGQLHLIV